MSEIPWHEWAAVALSPEIIGSMTVASILMVAVSLVVTPWALVRLPADYFHRERPHLGQLLRRSSTAKCCLLLIKNLAGVVFLCAGILMLVLPGQGLLTIFISLLLLDFPHKQNLEKRIISNPKILKTVNWLRRRHRKPALRL